MAVATPPQPSGALPKPPEKQVLQLPGGASLVGMVAPPRGLGEDCTVAFNLMLQLGPFMGNLECLLRIMKFLGWLLDFVKAVGKLPDPTGVVQELEKLPPIADALMECVLAFTPAGICPPVKQMLQLILSYLHCILDVIQSITEQQLVIGVQMAGAQGNPELQSVLQVAQDNADKMGLQAMRSCEPVFGLLQMMGTMLDMFGSGGLSIPSLDGLTGGQVGQALQPLNDLTEVLQQIADALPC
jgi:hypothetical protein